MFLRGNFNESVNEEVIHLFITNYTTSGLEYHPVLFPKWEMFFCCFVVLSEIYGTLFMYNKQPSPQNSKTDTNSLLSYSMGKQRGKAKAYAKNPATASEWEQNLWNCFLHFWSNMLILYMNIKVLSKNKLVYFAKSLEIISSSTLLLLSRACRNSVSQCHRESLIKCQGPWLLDLWGKATKPFKFCLRC